MGQVKEYFAKESREDRAKQQLRDIIGNSMSLNGVLYYVKNACYNSSTGIIRYDVRDPDDKGYFIDIHIDEIEFAGTKQYPAYRVSDNYTMKPYQDNPFR